MKKFLVGILSVMSFVIGTSAFAQFVNTNGVAFESSRLAQLSAQLQQQVNYSPDYNVRSLAYNAQQIGYTSNDLWRSARGICGRPDPDTVIISKFEAVCDPVQRLLDAFQFVRGTCDFRVASLVNEIGASLENLRGLVGDSGHEGGGHPGEGPGH